MIRLISNSAEETEKIGERLARELKGTEVIALFGGLGMGKTAFTRGLSRGLGIQDGVSSPTFDMYRVKSWDDLYSTGFFDYLDSGVLVIEWSENIEGALPEGCIRISITGGEHENQRRFEIEGVEKL